MHISPQTYFLYFLPSPPSTDHCLQSTIWHHAQFLLCVPHSFDSLFHELLLSQLVSVWIYSTLLAKNSSASFLSAQALIRETGKDKMRLWVRVEKGKNGPTVTVFSLVGRRRGLSLKIAMLIICILSYRYENINILFQTVLITGNGVILFAYCWMFGR